jgi:hypothetical protein
VLRLENKVIFHDHIAVEDAIHHEVNLKCLCYLVPNRLENLTLDFAVHRDLGFKLN